MEKLKTTKTQLGNEICLIGAKSAPRRESKVLIIGVFHGDEPQGKFLIEEYLKQISDETSKNLLFIPCLNPDGMLAGTRTNAAGVDLNRNFPTRNWGEDTSKAGPNAADYFGGKSAGSEIETGFCIDVINEYKPKAILTLHAPYKIVNFDGPARELAEKISKIIGYPVEESIGYPTPGSFGTYSGVERNIPTITLELDEKIPVEDLLPPVFEIFNSIS